MLISNSGYIKDFFQTCKLDHEKEFQGNKGSLPNDLSHLGVWTLSVFWTFLFIGNPFNDISEIAMRALYEFESTVKPETESFQNGSWINTKPGKLKRWDEA